MRALFVLLLLCSLAACSDPASEAEAIGHAQLKADAVAMVEASQQAHGYVVNLPRDVWPDSIRQLDPIEVRNHMFGVLVITEKTDAAETGIYIVTYGDATEEQNPSAGNGLDYRMIEPGLHHTSLKLRLASSGS